MQFWLSRRSTVPISEQLATQIVLGILSGDLPPGQRLPSTRELARRFKVHANTISAGYRKLEREGWVHLRHGSGIYIRDMRPETKLQSTVKLDQLIAEFFHSARQLGVSLADLRSGLRRWLELQPPDHFVLIEPDEDLARIVASELQSATRLPIRICAVLTADETTTAIRHAIPLVLPRKEKVVRKLLPDTADPIVLKIRSVPSSLAEWLPAPSEKLVAVASPWPEFLKLARTMLLAAGFHRDTLILRDARARNWRRGLAEVAAVVCDILTAQALDGVTKVIPFPLVAESSIAELRRYEVFISSAFDAL